ncbi:Uncharacterized protein Adt_13591 [Abeliophyllum distichum]|uniref:Uncharacterized protein n=1 Tax=Abeliophyllum distichum TaxID=126358 RepID=A0ABD1TX82_9LAMI
MSSSAAGGDAIGRVGDKASPSMSPSMEGVLPIRGVDGNTGEAIPIDTAPGLSEADDPFRADIVRWATLDVPSIMVEKDLMKLREAYRIPADIELMILGPNERVCFPRRGCTALYLNAFVSGMRLLLHTMFRRILRAYGLAPTQVAPNGWNQNGGGACICGFGTPSAWKCLCMCSKPFIGRESCQRRRAGRRKRSDTLPRCELSKDVVNIVRSIYQAALLTQSYGLILNKHRYLVELGLMASKGEASSANVCPFIEAKAQEVAAPDVVEIEDTGVPEREVPLKKKRKGGASGLGPSQSKKKVELVDNYTVCAPQPLQRTLSVNPSGEVVLDSPPRANPVYGGSGVGPFDSRKTLRELIGPPGSRISDDTLRNVPFFPSIGAQAVKKYFTSKWEEFASHGELEDVLEASLAVAVRATSLQMKVLREFWTRMESWTFLRKRRTEAKAEVTRLLGEKNEMEAKLKNVEADFIANFHNTEAYTNFSDYFAKVGHQKVLAALRAERPDLDLGPLGDRFSPSEADEEEGS